MSVLQRNVDRTQVFEWQDGETRCLQDWLVAEEPLEIRVDGTPLSVTMRTPGHELELAAGFLFTEGLIRTADQVSALRLAPSRETRKDNVVEVELTGARIEPEHLHRNFFATSSCGICGKASIDSVRVRGIQHPNPHFKMHPDILYGLPEKLRAGQAVFGRTGALHAAAIFSVTGELLALREDVGRHNAVDKVVGWALLGNMLPLSEHVLMVSGRGGFEIVQKALAAGLPIVASVSAPSGLAVQLARELGLTLVGFLRGRRFVVYAGAPRCIWPAS